MRCEREMKMTFNRKKKLAISAAITIPIAVFLIIAMIPTTTTYRNAQIGSTLLESQVENAEKILVGKVVNVEVKQIDQFVEVPDDPQASFWTHDIYQFVTVEATKYLKDETGEYPKQVTFIDEVTGCFDWLKKQCQVSEYAIDYKVGDRALFILKGMDDPADGPLDGQLSAFGYLRTYKIADDKAQSEYEESHGKAPKKLVDLEKEIKQEVEKQKGK